MLSISHIEMSNNCSRTWQYLTLSPIVSRKIHTSKVKLQRGSEGCTFISFYFVKLDTGTHFSLQRQSSPSHLVFYYGSRRISNSEQSSDETEFFEVETAIKIKLCCTGTTQPKTQPSREGVKFFRGLFRGGGGKKLSTQFLQMQKNQLIDLQEHFERYCNALPVFGFNSPNYDIILIKSYLLPILVNERGLEPTVIKKANQFVSFNFGDLQLLDIMKFLGGATSLDSFLKDYNTKETKGFFPYEWFDCPEKMNNKELPPYDSFFSILRNNNPL